MSEARRVKSRAGCSQCKRRKVKCDESLPSCQQCVGQNLSCPGYQKPLKWIEPPTELQSASGLNHHNYPSNASKISVRDFNLSHKDAAFRVQDAGLLKPLHDESSVLIAHYFTRVCRISGCFDSGFSPFRIVPAAMMGYSEPVFLLLQASSAAQLSRHDPKMRLKALRLQGDAFSAIRNDIGRLRGPVESIVSDELMLSSIIAGLTSAWYDVNDIGQSHVLGSQVLLSLWLISKKDSLDYQQTFILGAYAYWLCMTAFVAGDPYASFHFQEALQTTIRNLKMCHDVVDDKNFPEGNRNFYPHPLTGFSIELFVCIGKVGSLCRLRQIETAMVLPGFLDEKARLVESELLDLIQSQQSNFKDPQDPQTTINEILAVGEAYRCAGLLQLYTTFPELLKSQGQHLARNGTDNLEMDCVLEIEAIRSNSTGDFTSLEYNWLRALAFHILNMLETIPPTSGTRVLQGLPVLIAATWLVDPLNRGSTGMASEGKQTSFEHPQLPLRLSSASKEHWRDVVRHGLRFHNEYVGLQQVSRVLEIVEEVWRLDDSGDTKCHWMVVVASKRLQTLYG